MASLIQNYVNSLQTIQNPFVYGYNGLNNRMEDASIQKHGVGSFGTTGSFDTEKLALMLEKMLGFPNSYLPPTQHFKMPMAPSNAVCRETNIWCGELPPRNYCNPVFSPKVFIGGIPWDISELTLLDAFLPYGVCKVEWPGNSNLRGPKAILRNIARSKASGYVYIIFEAEQSVRALLQDCAQTFGSAGELYFRLRTRRNRTTEFRQVQVIPWVISDAMYIPQVLDVNMRPCFLDTTKTVFVGALHGMMTATILGAIMEEQFGPVVYVGINTDKNKYPIGSGRVTFTNSDSYDRAVDCEFLEIRTSKFNKKIQIDPFLEDAKCSTCVNEIAPYFCRFKSCFKYFCQRCWHVHYESEGSNFKHRMLIHNTRRMSLNSNEETLSSSGGNYAQLFRGESSEST